MLVGRLSSFIRALRSALRLLLRLCLGDEYSENSATSVSISLTY